MAGMISHSDVYRFMTENISSSSPSPSPSSVPNTRNITILAHVDHGKTTLCDQLISQCNKSLSARQAGVVRLLDCMEEERRRGITIRASGFGILYDDSPPAAAAAAAAPPPASSSPAPSNPHLHLINLLDSPGHIDFSHEVLTSLSLTEGHVLLVDALEGVCVRTVALIRLGVFMRRRGVLVINKVDRVLEAFCPMEGGASEDECGDGLERAAERLRRLVENVNACVGVIVNSLTSDEGAAEAPSSSSAAAPVAPYGEGWDFSPEKGNVVFASALHGWAFRLSDLSKFWAKRINARSGSPDKKLVTPKKLTEIMFDPEYSLTVAPFKIVKVSKDKKKEYFPLLPEVPSPSGPPGGGGGNLSIFGGLCLGVVYELYKLGHAAASLPGANSAFSQGGKKSGEHIARELLRADFPPNLINSLNLRELSNGTGDQRAATVLRAFLPLAGAVCEAVIENCPEPKMAGKNLPPSDTSTLPPTPPLPTDAPSLAAPTHTKAFSAKYMAFKRRDVVPIPPQQGKSFFRSPDPTLQQDPDDILLFSLARVFEGALVNGSSLNILDNNNVSPPQQRSVGCFICMGGTLYEVPYVPAGNTCALSNVENVGFKTFTISSDPEDKAYPPVLPLMRPIVKVAVEAVKSTDVQILEEGLKRLESSDSTVEVELNSRGEYILAGLGEVHLEQTLKDLVDVYCTEKIEIRCSKQIVPFRETVTILEGVEKAGADRFSLESFKTIAKAKQVVLGQMSTPPYSDEDGLSGAKNGICRYVVEGKFAITVSVLPSNIESEADITELSKHVNILASSTENKCHFCERKGGLGELLVELQAPAAEAAAAVPTVEDLAQILFNDLRVSTPANESWQDLRGPSIAGFHDAVKSAPMCDEPMHQVVVICERVEFFEGGGEIGARMVGAMKQAIRCAFLSRPCRLVESYVKCNFQASLKSLGPVYATLSKRRGQIIKEDMVEGTELISVEAAIPMAETTGICNELLERSSGDATSPMMAFSHWECIDEDPFWRPTTEEEREEFGEGIKRGDTSTGVTNLGGKYVRAIRSRKGLANDDRLVVAADKQRNLNRKR